MAIVACSVIAARKAAQTQLALAQPKCAEVVPEAIATPEPEASNAGKSDRAGPNWLDDGSYVVGKGKTPVHTRWQKGQSGNPKGKKKGIPNTDTIIIDLMETPITVKTAAGEKKMSRKAALFQRMWELAAKGDLKAGQFLFARYAEAQGRRAVDAVEHEKLSSDELAAVESFMAAMQSGSIELGSEGVAS